MGAHKHHCLVCLHTPQYSPINANPHNPPTKLPPSNATTHNLPTKVLPDRSPTIRRPLRYHSRMPTHPTNYHSLTTINHHQRLPPRLQCAPHTTKSALPPTQHNTTHTRVSKTTCTYHLANTSTKKSQEFNNKLSINLPPKKYCHQPTRLHTTKIKQPPHQNHTKNHTNNHKKPQNKPTHPKSVNHTSTPNYPKTSKPPSTKTHHKPQLKSDPQH